MNKKYIGLIVFACWLMALNFPALGKCRVQSDDFSDVVELNNGTVIKGRVLSDNRDSGRRIVRLELESGGVVGLDTASLVRRVRKSDGLEEEFWQRLERLSGTIESYWELYDWCEAQPTGKRRFADQRQFLLEKIIELDPEHPKARRELGHEKFDGRWYLADAWYRSYGYQRKGTGWQSTISSEFATAASRAAENRISRQKELERWFEQASKPAANRAAARAELLKMAAEDEMTVGVLFDWLRNDKRMSPALRPFYLEVFGSTPPNAWKIGALCHFALMDPDVNLQDRALSLLMQPGFDPESAASLLSGYLNPDNLDVNKPETIKLMERAAFIIGELGTRNQLMSMINALEIRGEITRNDPGRTAVGNVQGNLSFNPGAGPVKEPVVFRSDTVQSALKKITEQDFGFNRELWKSWYLQNFTANDRTFRADD